MSQLVRYLTSYRQSIAFVVSSHLGRLPSVQFETIELDLPERKLVADVYQPSKQQVTGTIVFVHGMTAHAQRDPRIIQSCQRLTLSGCRVVAPCYPEIAAFGTGIPIASTLEQSFLAILEHPLLKLENNKIAIFSASFGSLFSLMAASRASLDGKISSLCFIGGAYSGEVFADCLRKQDDYHFSRQVLLLNYLEQTLGSHPHVIHALQIALDDNSLKREPPQLPDVLASMPEDECLLFLRLQDDQAFRMSVANQFIPSVISVINEQLARIGALQCSVILIHGAEDSVLPPSESQKIYTQLCKFNVRTSLEVSPLIAHTTSLTFSLTLVSALMRIIKSFAHFFHDASCFK